MASSSKNEWKTKIALLFFSLVFSLVGLEILFRLVHQEQDSQNKKNVAWKDRPHYWCLPESSVDNRDFRYAREKPENVFRIAIVGDSFTYGGSLSFDDNYSKRLERMLNLNNVQKKIEIMNLGVPGYNTKQEIAIVSKAIKKFHVDLIILQVTLNDAELEPYHLSHAASYKREKLITENKLLQHWKSAAFIAYKIHLSMMAREYKKYHKELFSNPKNWSTFENSLDNINSFCKSNNVKFFAFLFPLFSDPFDQRYPFGEEHNKIKEKFNSIAVPFLDLLSEYKDIPPERLQATPGEDYHPNEIAHRIAAQAIYKEITEKKLVPEDAIAKNVCHNYRRLISPFPKNKEKEEE